MAREISETAAALVERATATDQAMASTAIIDVGGKWEMMDRATLLAVVLSPPVLNVLADRIASRLIEDLGRDEARKLAGL